MRRRPFTHVFRHSWHFLAATAVACAPHALTSVHVPRTSVTGRAAAAVGDTGVFASPVLPNGVRPVIPPADAESAAVAMGYWESPVDAARFARTAHNVPTERRRFCGRSFYVRPIVAMPDTTIVRSMTANDWMMWAPTWVMPICDEDGHVHSSVYLADLPMGARVVAGPEPLHALELDHTGPFPHIGFIPSSQMGGWESGIGMPPEAAVTEVTSLLQKTGAHVAEVPEAFAIARLLDPSPPEIRSPRIFGGSATCPRWRLTLDRPVSLRGAVSGQIVKTRTVYVTRREDGCRGTPQVQIPKPAQPDTVPFMWIVNPTLPPGSRITSPPPPDLRWMMLRVLEPLWFEEARLEP